MKEVDKLRPIDIAEIYIHHGILPDDMKHLKGKKTPVEIVDIIMKSHDDIPPIIQKNIDKNLEVKYSSLYGG